MFRKLMTGLITLAALAVTASTQAIAYDPVTGLHSIWFDQLPSEDGNDGKIVVKLNNQGEWKIVPKNTVRYRLNYGADWAIQPESYEMIRIVMGYGQTYYETGSGDIVEAGYSLLPGQITNLPNYFGTVTVDPEFMWLYHGGGIVFGPASRCANEKASRLADGESLNELLSDGFVLNDTTYSSFAMLFDPGTGSDSGYIKTELNLPVQVVCQGDPEIDDQVDPPLLATNNLAIGFQISEADLFISPAYNGLVADCPVTVPLVAQFKGNDTGTVKFRFVSVFGQVSQTYSTDITGQTNGVYTVLYEKQISVPLPVAPTGGGTSGGQGGVINQSGEMTIEESPIDPIFPTVPVYIPDTNTVSAQETPGNLHSNSFRVEVLSPNKMVSAFVGYHITCKPKTVDGINPNQELTGAPKPNTGTPAQQLSQAQSTGDGGVGVIGGLAQVAPGKKTVQGKVQPSSIKVALGKPDLMATPLGMSLAGGVHAWGSSVVLSNPNSASAKGVGPKGNLCRFSPAAFRPFNKGVLPSGSFKMKVYRNNKQVQSANVSLPAKSGLPGNGWHKFNLSLAQGMNAIKVVLDSNKSVAESNEGNNVYTLRVRVSFPCGRAGTMLNSSTGKPTPLAVMKLKKLKLKLKP